MDSLDEDVKAHRATLGTGAAAPAVEDVLAGGGEMGALMRAFNWSATPIGPVENWPQSLRTAVSICLNSRFPILIWWGPEFVKLYNDAYSLILAAKHPRALGQRGRECWPEIWHIIGPMLDGVLSQGQATWSDDQLLLLERNGYAEECYFTFSYSPIRAESGGVGGVFTAVTETTGEVVGERRLRLLRELAARTMQARTARDACALAAEIMVGDGADLPFALLYLLDAAGHTARLAGAAGLEPGAPLSPSLVDLTGLEEDTGAWPLARVARTGEACLVDDLVARFGAPVRGAGSTPPHAALVLPLAQAGQERVAGLLVAGISPLHALDAGYRGFFDLVAGQVATAIADARAYEEERKRAEALAELDRAKSVFFSNVSHEFRTPLTLLLGPLEDALSDVDDALAPRQRERLEIARRNGRRLLKLVNTLLDFSRIEAGHVQAVYEPADLALLTADLASAFRSAIERAGLRFVVDCPPLPQPVYVDREMWEKIVLNLLSNAFKFTLEGEIALTLHPIEGGVALEVRDTGTGIPAEELPRLFERFHRVRGARARTHEGSGIGLSLVQELVRLHGGALEVTSEIGAGTAFTVTLPSGTAHLPPDRIEAARTLTSTALGTAPYVEEALRWLPEASRDTDGAMQGQGEQDGRARVARAAGSAPPLAVPSARILLADDNADMRDYLRRLLSERWTVEAVADGAAALAAALERVPDLVLSDVMMPGLDGVGLLRALRADPRTSAVPVVLLSARAGEESAVAGLEAGADDYLVKPFTARELLARVGAHVELARAREQESHHERQHTQRWQQLARASLAINSALSLDDMLRLVTEQARAIIGAHQSVISLSVNDAFVQKISAVSLSEKYAAWREYDEQPGTTGMPRLVCAGNTPLRLTQAELEAHPAWTGFGKAAGRHPPMRGWLAAPLLGRDGRNLGLIQLSDKNEGEFTENDEAIVVQLAQIASVAIENARLYAQAQEAVRLRNDFLSNVSHDLKTPLTAVKGTAQLLRRRVARTPLPASDDLLDGLDSIDVTTTTMAALIDELLDVARLQAGQSLDLHQRLIDLVALARKSVAECQQEAAQRQLRVEATAQTPVLGDGIRLERVLANLLSNAIKYSPDGGEIIVAVAPITDEAGAAWATLAVRDHGIGIPAADLPHIFERFHRAANVTGQIAGTGIGLAGARQIVEQHGGSIAVVSQEGAGTTVTVRLPLAE